MRDIYVSLSLSLSLSLSHTQTHTNSQIEKYFPRLIFCPVKLLATEVVDYGLDLIYHHTVEVMQLFV